MQVPRVVSAAVAEPGRGGAGEQCAGEAGVGTVEQLRDQRPNDPGRPGKGGAERHNRWANSPEKPKLLAIPFGRSLPNRAVPVSGQGPGRGAGKGGQEWGGGSNPLREKYFFVSNLQS